MLFSKKPFKWIEKIKFKSELTEIYPSLDDIQKRSLLIQYCQNYQDIYHFDQLESVFEYFEFLQEFDESELTEQYLEAKRDIEYGMGEYFISLNEVSEGLYRIFDKKELSIDCIYKAINHILEAYSCNKKPEDFLEREDKILCKMLKNI